MVAETVGRWGRLDILHNNLRNNVGIESRQTLMDTTEQEWDRVMVVDLKSMLLATQAAVPALEPRGATVGSR
jgi:NAD(P)-dependent dehydrogenase (short-subunit alcohol dehydrogenase family)